MCDVIEINLEGMLDTYADSDFPPLQQGKQSYPQEYRAIKTALQPIQNNIALGAMMNSQEHIDFLNDHGPNHVLMVIKRVSELISYCSTSCLHGGDFFISPYELFLLLCAIQVHDIGNIHGRSNHEANMDAILLEHCQPIIIDSIELRYIRAIAKVHSGKINDSLDTIGQSNLKRLDTYRDSKIRPQLLAALLRFADELADDFTRANYAALQTDIISPYSKICHCYSQSLNSIGYIKNPINGEFNLALSYAFDSTMAVDKFKYPDESGEKYLLDFIYERTSKMERERKYCMQFLRPYLSIEEIKVQISVHNVKNDFDTTEITYSLRENGYPESPKLGDITNVPSGQETAQHFMREGAVV